MSANAIESLPTETLMQIFGAAVALASARSRSTLVNAPLNLTHVCSLWRNLAISDARLWTCIDCVGADTRVMALYVQRSSSLELDVTISPVMTAPSEDHLKSFFGLLLSQQMRFKSLSFRAATDYGSERSNLDLLMPFRLFDLSNVIDFSAGDGGTFYVGIYPELPFGRQCLSTLFIFPDTSVSFQPIAPRLRRLSLEWVIGGEEDMHGLLAMLRHCPSLEESRFMFHLEEEDDRDPIDEDAFTTCTLPKLRKLAVYTRRGDFLRLINTPALEVLEVDLDSWDAWDSDDVDDFARNTLGTTVPAFLGRSGQVPPVQIASLDGTMGGRICQLFDEGQERILRSLPSVKSLVIGRWFDESTCRLLSFSPRGRKLCPELEHLKIWVHFHTDPAPLERMLTTRFRASDTLRVSVHRHESELESHFSSLADLRSRRSELIRLTDWIIDEDEAEEYDFF